MSAAEGPQGLAQGRTRREPGHRIGNTQGQRGGVTLDWSLPDHRPHVSTNNGTVASQCDAHPHKLVLAHKCQLTFSFDSLVRNRCPTTVFSGL